MVNFGLPGVAIDRGAVFVCTHGLFSSHAIFEYGPPQPYPIEMSAAWGSEVRPWQPVRIFPNCLWIVRLWFIALAYTGLLAFAWLRPRSRRRGKRGFDVTEANAAATLEPPATSRV
jgi:hypothetical protein